MKLYKNETVGDYNPWSLLGFSGSIVY